MKVLMVSVFALGFILGMCITVEGFKRDAAKGPGIAPDKSFIDHGDEYSADGCWKLSDGYWRPLRRCNIVRFHNVWLMPTP